MIGFFSLILIANDYFLNMSNTLNMTIIAIGLNILGISNAFLLIPIMPYSIISLKKLFPKIEEKAIYDMASGIFTVCISSAEFQGPLIGGLFYGWFPFSKAVLINSLFIIVFLFWFGLKGGALKKWDTLIEESDKNEVKTILL
jgi:hypothetical protein